MTRPAVSGSPVWQPHFLYSHTHTYTELYFTLVGAVCYPSGSVPSACLPAHHINPIMLHCLACSGPGQLPSGKRGGGHEKMRKGKGKVRKREGQTVTQRLVRWNHNSGFGIYGQRRRPAARHKWHICTQKVVLYFQCETVSKTTFEGDFFFFLLRKLFYKSPQNVQKKRPNYKLLQQNTSC